MPHEYEQPNPDRSTNRIGQDVVGDKNQSIGQVMGGIVINHLTIHDRIPTEAAPPPFIPLPSLTQPEYRQRQVLLNKIKEYWIKGVLERSLQCKILIELGLTERTDAVQRPFQIRDLRRNTTPSHSRD